MESETRNRTRGDEEIGGPYLQMEGITKAFGANQVLRGVNFEVRAGEVMALLGENGAGKSTLIKILNGIHHPDSGVIRIGSRPADISSPPRAQAAGVAVVQQELSMVPTLSAAENVFLGHSHAGHWYTPRELCRKAAPFLAAVGLEDFDPNTIAGNLSVAEQQFIEVARLLARQARILVLDEPTAALNDVETERVKRVVRSLVAEGRSVIYVTHRLDEVFELANRVTVLRNGEAFPPTPITDLTVASVVERMIGRKLEQLFPPRASTFGPAVIAVRELQAGGIRKPISLSVRAGEILGLAGQLGSGTTFLLEALAGARPILAGSVEIKGKTLGIRDRRGAISAGIAFCSEDRKRDGIFAIRRISENLTAPALEEVSPFHWVSSGREKSLSTRLAQVFQIDTKRLGHPAGTLSGGNQQKVALGKWLGIKPAVLMVAEPTRGVDIGARSEIYSHLRKLANEGMAIVFASSDIQEVAGLADTIAAFYKGSLVNVIDAKSTDVQRLLSDVTHPRDEVVEVGA